MLVVPIWNVFSVEEFVKNQVSCEAYKLLREAEKREEEICRIRGREALIVEAEKQGLSSVEILDLHPNTSWGSMGLRGVCKETGETVRLKVQYLPRKASYR